MCQPAENKKRDRFACSALKNGLVWPVMASYTLLDLSAEIRQSDVVKDRPMSKLDYRIRARIARGVMARWSGNNQLPGKTLARGVRGMLKRTSLIVAGTSLAMMSCAIAGGNPGANTNASGNGTSSATLANASAESAQAAEGSENKPTTANAASSSGTQLSQNNSSAQGGGEQASKLLKTTSL